MLGSFEHWGEFLSLLSLLSCRISFRHVAMRMMALRNQADTSSATELSARGVPRVRQSVVRPFRRRIAMLVI